MLGYNRKKSRREEIRPACQRLSRSGQERLSRRVASNVLPSGRGTKRSGEEGVTRSPVGRKAPRLCRVRLIESVHPVWGSTLAPSVRLPVAAGSEFWSLSVAAVASCCSQHKPRPDFKSGRRHRRSLPRRFLIGSRISRVGEGTFQPTASP